MSSKKTITWTNFAGEKEEVIVGSDREKELLARITDAGLCLPDEHGNYPEGSMSVDEYLEKRGPLDIQKEYENYLKRQHE